MQSLEELAQEYMENVAVLEQRIAELEQQKRQTPGCQERLLLNRRIAVLYQMAGEGRQMAFEMQRYCNKAEEGSTCYVKPKSKPDKRRRVRFSKSGYGTPTPAAAICKPPAGPAARGIRAYLAGRDDAD